MVLSWQLQKCTIAVGEKFLVQEWSFRWNPDFPPLSGVGSLRRSWREVSGAGEDPDVAGGVGWGQELV